MSSDHVSDLLKQRRRILVVRLARLDQVIAAEKKMIAALRLLHRDFGTLALRDAVYEKAMP